MRRRSARRVPALDELRDHLLALANQKQIDEIGDRLGIEKHGGAAGDDQRKIAARAIGTARGNAGHAQNAQDVEVVGLEGNRKRENVEVGERTAALERDETLAALAERVALVGVGQKRAIGGDRWIGFKDVEDGLEAEIRHAEAVGVGIDDADGNVAAGLARVEHFFARDALERALTRVIRRLRHDHTEYRRADSVLKRSVEVVGSQRFHAM